MNRRALFLVPAALFLPGSVAFAVLAPPHTLLVTVLLACYFVSGLCFAVAGLRESVTLGSRTLPWYVFASVADVTLVAAMLLNAAQMSRGGTEDLFLAAVTGVAALPLLLIGVDYLRGGRHFDLSFFE